MLGASTILDADIPKTLGTIHVVTDGHGKAAKISAKLSPAFSLTSSLLGTQSGTIATHSHVIVDVDLTVAENLAMLREQYSSLGGNRKRIFLVDPTARLLVAQAYALGATHVLPVSVSEQRLRAALAEPCIREHLSLLTEGAVGQSLSQTATSRGAIALAEMFSAVSGNEAIDTMAAKSAASIITDAIAADGLSNWLETVRRHHEGTYQHCLLVIGVTIDFGLSLGMARADIERLSAAAMFHDIGKATIPLPILDKPGRLDPQERALIETHPVVGYDILKTTAGISSEVLDAVRHHHEYLDGSGYPDALCAESIPDIVRILTISDIFAALIEDRRYKPPMPREQAYEIICGMRGKLEWPLVAAFKDVALRR